jgi:hypothetical protein
MSSWYNKLGSAIGTFGKKGLSTFNSFGKGASALAHGVLDNGMVQGALATQPELFASINSAVAGGDALLEGTTDFEKWMTPPQPKKHHQSPVLTGYQSGEVSRNQVVERQRQR